MVTKIAKRCLDCVVFKPFLSPKRNAKFAKIFFWNGIVNNSNNVVIVGLGLSGMMMALYLVKHGYRVEIFEKNMDCLC